MKMITLICLTFAVNGAFAKAANIQTSDIVDTSNTTRVAMGTISNNDSWATAPLTFEATVHQKKQLNKRIQQLNTQMSVELDSMISESVTQSLDEQGL